MNKTGSNRQRKRTPRKVIPPNPDGRNENRARWAEAALAEFDTQLRLVGTGPNGALLASFSR